ncbi:hypothetical protein [Phreatobacter cathodiphilus]|uniref:Nuclease n=1 Tax=Phreatobacter cathodiphilus TaxID=1868589 RepID=A0A2S0NF25_9HYPH|nr:hypothetical protein [Phreatobacter cathodiphilus]AVO46762.1 hypothetical protein C6569_17760 [Phreatobacter cathodiphilus]
MGRAPALLAAALCLAPAPALACAPERVEEISGLRAEAPLTLAAVDGRRFRLAVLSGEAQVPADRISRIALLGPADRHERTPVLALGPAGPVETELLRRGLARLTPTRLVPRDCWRLLEAAETEAATARRGIWATPRSLLDTNDVEALKAAEGRFVVATGRVRSVRTVNRITYVNFGAPRAGALTVTIDERDMPAFREFGLEPAAIRGHMLRVRGVVTTRRGPFIAAAMPEAITIAEAPGRGAR